MTKETKIVVFAKNYPIHNLNEPYQNIMIMVGIYEVNSWDELILKMMDPETEGGVEKLEERMKKLPHFKDFNEREPDENWYYDLLDQMKTNLESGKTKSSEVLTYLEDKTKHKYPLTFVVDPNESVLQFFKQYKLEPGYWAPEDDMY